MTVAELIGFLKTQPQNLQVAYECFSEQALFDANLVKIVACCEPRADGWIESSRPDKPEQLYLMFPGN